MVRYVNKRQYEYELNEYIAWIVLIKILTFGLIDLSDAIDEIKKDYVVID